MLPDGFCFKVDKSDPSVIKWGVGGVDRPNRSSLCPIHLAVMNGHMVS